MGSFTATDGVEIVFDDPDRLADRGAAGFRALADATGADRRALAAIVRADPHRPGDLATVTVPTLVLAGEADPLAAGADELAAALPDARLQSVPGTHLGAVGSVELIEAIRGFLPAPCRPWGLDAEEP